ncbi:pre-mRNA-splicing factor ISY1 homolog [Ostrea edulis]|uniref:pre-mRNA-splicing factor ISY1 homolog n=1 Tax=Ostrea edulis TaxID=37623 RepID=UPI0024AF2A0E|nr:pre-mRNA-splicing factor ISY1 homolog [Ostrea edulis]
MSGDYLKIPSESSAKLWGRGLQLEGEATSSQKAMTPIARWIAAYLEEMSKEQERPYPATECEDLVRAKEWRQEIIDEISRKMEQIQNAGLGEFKLIDLNDQINILLLEKGEWDEQIKILGGPDYKEIGPKMMKLEWKEVPGNERYKYFGATKDLPGIRELFQQEAPPPLKKRLLRLTNDVDDDCYGCKDEGDGLIVAKEEEMEERGNTI